MKKIIFLLLFFIIILSSCEINPEPKIIETERMVDKINWNELKLFQRLGMNK